VISRSPACGPFRPPTRSPTQRRIGTLRFATGLGPFVAAVAFCWPQFAMATSWKKVFVHEASFEARATALSASEREKLNEKLREVQSSGGCIEYVVVTGHADEGTEGSGSRALARARSEYVATRITNAGIPSGLVQARVPTVVLAGCGRSSGACAEVEIQIARRGAPTCP